jgi:hypothetical protein
VTGRCEAVLDDGAPSTEDEFRGCVRGAMMDGMADSAPKALVIAGATIFGVALIGFIVSRARTGIAAAKAVPIGPLTAEMVASAIKWGAYYGIPPSWITATMIVESRGNPNAVGDQGRSRGLMQINYGANVRLLEQLGVTPDQLFIPDVNIRVGTKFMRDAYDRILQVLAGRQPPIPIDIMLRLYYRGPALVLNALKAGKNPMDNFKDGQVSASNWRAALNQTSAVV